MRKIYIFDRSNYSTYQNAKESRALYEYDVSHADDADSLATGALYEAISAMETALSMVGRTGNLAAALVVDDVIVDFLVA